MKSTYFRFLVFLAILLTGCNPSDNRSSYLVLGDDFLTKNQLDSAEFYFDSAFSLDSNNVEAINSLGEIYFRKIEIGKALKMFEKSVFLDSSNADIHLKIAEIKLFLGKYKEVFHHINNGLRINQRAPKGYFMKGVAYKHIGDTLKAISSYKTAIELNHDYAEVYYDLGLLLTLQKDSLAIDYYKNGIKVSPDDMGLALSLAWSYDVFGDYENADAIYKRVLTLAPNYPDGKYNYAVFKMNWDQADTALILCNEALVGNDSDYNLLNLKGTLLSRLGKESESKEIQRKLLLLQNAIEF